MPIEVLVRREWTPADRLRAREHPGRRTDGSQSAASWISDLSALRKVIVLCGICRQKFNPRKHAYRKLFAPDATFATDGFQAGGKCDACKQRTENVGGGVAFVHESQYALVCQDPADARRRARQRWR